MDLCGAGSDGKKTGDAGVETGERSGDRERAERVGDEGSDDSTGETEETGATGATGAGTDDNEEAEETGEGGFWDRRTGEEGARES